MAEKDMTEKTLEAYDDVFSDIVNVLLFNGKRVVNEDELVPESEISIYKADGKLHEQERDVAKFWKKGLVRIALYGFENQTDEDPDMPLRLFSYDGTAYRAQMLNDKKNREELGGVPPRFPVITLVLYFGYKNRWNTSKTLYDRLEIPGELKPYVNDYKMNLFEIAYLEDEQVEMFTSDFKIVADYFVQMRKNNEYIAPDTVIKHVHELLQLMSVMTQDNRFENVYNIEMDRRETKMCEVIDRCIEKGENNILTLVRYLMNDNRIDDLKKATEDTDYRKKLLSEMTPTHK